MRIQAIASNMTEYERGGTTFLISYSTPVAVFWKGRYYKTKRFFSQTTSRHIVKWLKRNGTEKAETIPQEELEILYYQTQEG